MAKQDLINKLTTNKAAPCHVTQVSGGGGNDNGGSINGGGTINYDISNVTITGGDWPSAVRDVYTWAQEVYDQYPGKQGERDVAINKNILPPTPSVVWIDCSGGVTQAIRAYWYRMKLANAPGFNEQIYKKHIEAATWGAKNLSSDTFSSVNSSTLAELGFYYVPFSLSAIQPYDIVGCSRCTQTGCGENGKNCHKDGCYGHAQIIGPRNSNGTYTIFSTTTKHKSNYKTIKYNATFTNTLSNGRYYNAIYRLRQ